MEDTPNIPDRTLPATRATTAPRTMGAASDAPSRTMDGTAMQSTFDKAVMRGTGRAIETYDTIPKSVIPDMSWTASLVTQNTGQLAAYGQPDLSVKNGVSISGATPQPITPYYDLANPLGLTADLFSKFFSNTPTESPQSPVIVGDTGTTTSGGSNTGLILILIVLGAVGYFIYRRYNK